MLIKWFNDIKEEDYKFLGKKAINLSKLKRLNLQVPHGFVLSTNFYDEFLKESNLLGELAEIKNFNLENEEKLQERITQLQESIMDSEMSFKLKNQILEAYNNLNVNIDVYKLANIPTINMIKAGRDSPSVAVRISLNNSYIKNPSAFLNVRGNQNIISTIQKCFASILTRELISNKKNIKPSIIIQKMVNPQISGTSKTTNSSIIIKSILGSIEPIKTNIIEPDFFSLEKETHKIIDRKVNTQDEILTKDDNTGETVKKSVYDKSSRSQKLNDYDMINLAKTTEKIESIFSSEIEIEYAVESSKTYLLGIKQVQESKIFETKQPKMPQITEKSDIEENVQEPIMASEEMPNSEEIKDYYASFKNTEISKKTEDTKNNGDNENFPIKLLANGQEFSLTMGKEADWELLDSILKTLKDKWRQDN